MRKKKSRFSNKYFEKKFNKRKNKKDALYYSTEIKVAKDDKMKDFPEINVCIFSIDDPKNKKEIENYSYQQYLRENYSSKKDGNYDE